MTRIDLETAVHNLNSRDATVCDKCERRSKCYEEGKLIVFTLLSDYAYEEAYGHKGSHGMLKLGEKCPTGRR